MAETITVLQSNYPLTKKQKKRCMAYWEHWEGVPGYS